MEGIGLGWSYGDGSSGCWCALAALLLHLVACWCCDAEGLSR